MATWYCEKCGHKSDFLHLVRDHISQGGMCKDGRPLADMSHVGGYIRLRAMTALMQVSHILAVNYLMHYLLGGFIHLDYEFP